VEPEYPTNEKAVNTVVNKKNKKMSQANRLAKGSFEHLQSLKEGLMEKEKCRIIHSLFFSRVIRPWRPVQVHLAQLVYEKRAPGGSLKARLLASLRHYLTFNKWI